MIEIFWFHTIGGDHPKQPRCGTVIALGLQVEIVVNNPLVYRDGLSHG